MSLNFKYIELTFQKDEQQIKEHIRNTVIFKTIFEKYNKTKKLDSIIVDTQYGYNASAKPSGKNKFLRISDITDGKVDWNSVPFCDCDSEKSYLLKPNDILIARTGGTTGKSFLIKSPPKHSIYAGYLIRIRAKEGVNHNFINLFLNSYVYWAQITSLNKGQFRPKVNANSLKNLVLPYCEKEVQDEMVRLSNGENLENYKGLISRINFVLDKYEKSKLLASEADFQSKLITQLRQAILQEAIEGKLTKDWRAKNKNVESAQVLLDKIKVEKERLIKEKKIKKPKPLPPITKEEIPFELSEGWVWCRLGEICRYIQRGKSPKYSEKQDIPVISQKCVQNSGFDLSRAKFIIPETIEKYSTERLLQTNDLLWNSTGDGTVGRVNLFPDVKYKIAVADSHVTVVRAFKDKLIPEFLLIFTSSPLVQDIILGRITGSTKQTELGTGVVKALEFALPPVAEQKAIVEKVEILLKKCEALEREVTVSKKHVEQLMKAVLKEAFEETNLI